MLLSCFSRVRLCETPQTEAHRLPCPWDSPGKNTGVGCHFLLQEFHSTSLRKGWAKLCLPFEQPSVCLYMWLFIYMLVFQQLPFVKPWQAICTVSFNATTMVFYCGDKEYMTASFIISKVLCVSDKLLLVNVLIHKGLLHKSMYVSTRQSCQRFCNGQKKDYYVSYQ